MRANAAVVVGIAATLLYRGSRQDVYDILWAVVFGFATLNILSLTARRFDGRANASLGGELETGRWVRSLDEPPPARAVLLDVDARQLLAALPATGCTGAHQAGAAPISLRARRVCKVDWALSGPVPWSAKECREAGTVHVGGSFAEVASSEADVHRRPAPRSVPYCIVVQPGVADPTRAPAGQGTLWAYCHVPGGSTVDMTAAIESQIERFAPGSPSWSWPGRR